MKFAVRILVVIALALGSVVASPSVATANSASTVDYDEFAEVKLNYTLAQVTKIFDSAGITDRVDYRSLVKKYRVAYGAQRLDVGVSFHKWDGVWRVYSKWVHWTWDPSPTRDPATKAEFVAIKDGMTLAQVRSIIGSPGTRSADRTGAGGVWGPYAVNPSTRREYMWPDVGGIQGHVVVTFQKKNNVYVVTGKGGVAWP